MDKIGDGREHRGNHVRARSHSSGGDMLQQQTSPAMNEENLLDAIFEGAEEDDLAEGFAGAPGFPPPAQRAGRKTLLQRLVQGNQHGAEGCRDGLADGWTEQRENGTRQDLGALLYGESDRGFDRGKKGRSELAVPLRAKSHGFGKNAADHFRI